MRGLMGQDRRQAGRAVGPGAIIGQDRANTIAPGFIATEMTQSMKPEALERIAAGIPAKRMGQPDEIAHAVTFLLENDYMSGRTVEVDGGLRL